MLSPHDNMESYGLYTPAHRLSIPIGPQCVATVLDETLARNPNSVAIVGRDRRYTYRGLDAAVNAAAAFLRELAVQTGTRVAASAPNQCEIVIAFLASQRLGAIWVGINRNYTAAEKLYLLNDSGASIYLTDRPDEIRIADCPLLQHSISMAPAQPNDWDAGLKRHMNAPCVKSAVDPFAPAAIAYTSGTTGFPKGAVHSQHNIMVAATMTEEMAGDRRPEVIRGTCSPLTILNIMIGGPVATLSRGLRQVCMDRIDILGVIEWVKNEGINTLNLVPTLVYDLLSRPDVDPNDLRTLTWMVVGAALVPEALPALYQRRFGHRMTIGYGLTENPTAVSRSNDATSTQEGAIGSPLPHLRVAILNESDVSLPYNSVGEICVRATDKGPWRDVYTPCLGYWRQPGETAKLLRGGWMHTGDLGYLDGNQQLYIKARRSDLIIRGGANIYPAEIERVVREHARIQDCAVISQPDPRLGEVPVAFVQVKAGQEDAGLIAELQQHCAARIAKYKIPVAWQVIDALPRNAMGKVVKQRLKDLLPPNT